MVAIDRHPSRRDLLVFSCGVPIVLALIGAARWHAGAPAAARGWWIAAAVAAVVLAALPVAARRRLYVGWMTATYPLAWTVTHAVLVVAYFGVATPTSLVLRALRRDPLQRRLDRAATSYWTRRPPARDDASYFRQF